MMDPLDELSRLAGSSLPTFGGVETVPRNRSLNELRAANESVNGGPTPSIPAQNANPFLRDFPTLRSSSAPPKPGVQLTHYNTPEERVDAHLERLTKKYMQMEQDDTRRIVDNLYEKRVQKAHEESMKRYVASLHGSRTLGGSSSIPLSSMSLTATNVDDLDPHQVWPYLQIVHKWNRNPQAPLEHVLQAFQNLATSPADSCAWRLLENIAARGEPGALSFYCHQFQQIVKTRVREATAAGQDTSIPYALSNGMTQMLASYVKLTTNMTTSPWPVVYYSLRCGDAVAALNVIDAFNSVVDSSVRRVVSALCEAQGSLSCIWDAPAPPAVSASDRQAVAALYDRSKHQDSPDPFQVACLALLSVKESEPLLSSPVVKTTEDYMFGGIWYALQQSYPREAIVEMGKNIQELGPTSFPTESEWGYALPLLAAQQYRAALTHVAKTNLLQATHAAMVLDAAGDVLNDVGSAVVALDAASVVLNDVGNAAAAQTTCLLTKFLIDYANKLQQKDAFAAIEYLVRIPNVKRAQSEVARVLVDTQQLNELNTPLEELFADKVSDVFVEAAEQARIRGSSDVAAHLYFLAGRYDLLLALINRQLASDMVDGINHIDWYKKALQFHGQYLSTGNNSQAMRVLQERDAMDRLETFQILMDLHTAFECVRTKEFERAWQLMEKLPLLPFSDAECTSKARQYASLDPVIKKVFPMVLEKALETLSQLYVALKSPSYGQSTNPEQQRLRRVAQLLLIDFAGILQSEIPLEVYTRMTNIEKSMV